jgi:hypothetical protein
MSQISNGESGASSRVKINTVLAGLFTGEATSIGSELLAGGDLASDPSGSGWFFDTGVEWSSGQLLSSVDNDGSIYPDFSLPIEVVAGHAYKIVYHQTITGDVGAVYFDNASSYYFTSTDDVVELAFIATITGTETVWFDFDEYNDGATRTITSISIHEATVAEAIVITAFDGTVLLSVGGSDDPVVNLPNVLLSSPTSGYDKLGIGTGALASNSSGGSNIAIGPLALNSNTTHSQNTAIGTAALQNSDSDGNLAIGPNTLQYVTTGNYNHGIGVACLPLVTTGVENVAYGDNTFEHLTTGSRNIGIGSAIGPTLVSGSDNILIGLGSSFDVPDADTSSYLNIGNVIMGDMVSGPLQIMKPVIIKPPTSDPHVVGALWNNSGTPAISAG